MNNPTSTPISSSRRHLALLAVLGGVLLLSIFILQRTPDPSAEPVASSELVVATELNASQESAVDASAGTEPEQAIVDYSGTPKEIVSMREATASDPEASADQVSPAAPNSPPEPAMVVELTNTLTFSPRSISIQTGETVEWRNTSLMVHTVSADPSKATVDGSVSLPSGGQPFDSGNLNPEAIFRHTFRTPGTYRYFCIPHEGVRMRGAIRVQ